MEQELKSVKNRLFIIIYINVGNLSMTDVKDMISKAQYTTPKFSDLDYFFLPIKEGETRIEYISTFDCKFKKSDTKHVEEILTELNKNYKKFLETIIEDKKEETLENNNEVETPKAHNLANTIKKQISEIFFFLRNKK